MNRRHLWCAVLVAATAVFSTRAQISLPPPPPPPSSIDALAPSREAARVGLPRLASLSPAQEKVIRQLPEALAFTEDSIWQEDACRALEEWWIENALYRPSR